MIKTSDSIVAISKALLTFQGQVDGVGKTKSNPAFKGSRYATLENVRDTAVPGLQKVGVFFMQSAGAIVDGVMSMSTRLTHAESGEWMEGTMDIPLGKRDPQGMGSAQSYAQRYQLMAMLGLPAVDDDAEDAVDRRNERPTHSQASTEPAQPKLSYNGYGAALIAATNITGLKGTFGAIWLDGSLTQGEKDNLKGQYERLRDKMNDASRYKAPDFSGMEQDIPFAESDPIQEALGAPK